MSETGAKTPTQISGATPKDSTPTASTPAPKGHKPRYTDTTKAREILKTYRKEKDFTLVERYASAGLADKQMAVCMGISETSLNRLKGLEGFRSAYKKGKETPIRQVEQSIFLQSIGYFIEEEEIKYEPSTGRIISKVIKRKYYAPNPIASMYWLNNMKPATWKHSAHMEQTVTQMIAFPEFDKYPAPIKKKILDLGKKKDNGEDIREDERVLRDEIAKLALKDEQKQ